MISRSSEQGGAGGKEVAKKGVKFSLSSCCKGPAELDPALNLDGTIKEGCSMHHFGFRSFSDANFVS